MKRAKYSAKQIVKWLVKRAQKDNLDDFTQIKIQKLLYLCQAYNLSLNDSPLFNDKIIANDYGPTVSSVVSEIKSYGNQNITDAFPNENTEFDAETNIVLEFVYNKFKKRKVGYLVDLTHEDSAWRETQVGSEISKEKIKSCYDAKKDSGKPSEDLIRTIGKLILIRNEVAFKELAK